MNEMKKRSYEEMRLASEQFLADLKRRPAWRDTDVPNRLFGATINTEGEAI